MSLRTLFLDFNSYFASVEQQEHPELRGRPVVVIPVEAETTCCIAVSREAKILGVRRGMRVADARRICLSLAVVVARPPLYVGYHHRLVAAVDRVAPVQEVHSIDEMACALPRDVTTREQARELALAVKRSIAQLVGPQVRCSIGVAPNAFLAKAACEMQKPDGLTLIEAAELPGALHRLELGDLTGIGPSMQARLHRAGIHTVAQLCEVPRPHFRRLWGSVEGERIHDLLHGGQVRRPRTQRSLISHSHVLAPAQRNEEAALAVLHRLLQKAATRLRRLRHFARGLALFVECSRRGGYSADLTFAETQDTFALTAALERLWAQRPPEIGRPMMVGVSLLHLLPAEERTLPLFRDAGDERRERLSHTMDTLNARFGKNTVFLGAAQRALDSAPMRIAFNFIPEIGD